MGKRTRIEYVCDACGRVEDGASGGRGDQVRPKGWETTRLPFQKKPSPKKLRRLVMKRVVVCAKCVGDLHAFIKARDPAERAKP